MLQRVKNVIVGCSYGDAMGMPTEMLSYEKIKELFPEGVNGFYPSTKEDFFGRNLPKGSITDDTIHTLLLADCLIKNEGKVTAELYVDYLQKWYLDNREVAPMLAGPSTIKALQQIINGTSIEKTGLLGRTNGALMKITPVGIIEDYHDMNSLVDVVEQVCIPTHNTSIAISGASAIAACISYGVRGGNDTFEMWRIAKEAATIGAKRGNQIPFASISKRIEEMDRLVKEKTREEVIDLLVNFLGTTEQVLDTIGAVYTAIAYGNKDIYSTAKYCAQLGADTDTIGAIAVAIAGALGGEASVEAERLLSQTNNIDFDFYAENLTRLMK